MLAEHFTGRFTDFTGISLVVVKLRSAVFEEERDVTATATIHFTDFTGL